MIPLKLMAYLGNIFTRAVSTRTIILLTVATDTYIEGARWRRTQFFVQIDSKIDKIFC
jgi:hypothetical protein